MGLDEFLAHLGTYGTRVDRPIGFDLRQLNVQRSGGYTSISLNLVTLGQKILALECIQSGDTDSWTHISPEILKAWTQEPLKDLEDQLAKRTDMRVAFARYVDHSKIEELLRLELGAPAQIAPAGALQGVFNLLVYPFDILHVGESCYIGGEKPSGRVAVDQLIKAERFDLIRAVLRGPNPEGRAYAAQALLENKQATAEDKEVIQKLAASTIPIYVCAGCKVYTKSFTEVIKEPRLSKETTIFGDKSRSRRF